MTEERLQKFLSRAGVASRRHAEDMITNGRVKVNGKVVTKLGTKVDPGRDKVEVSGKVVSPPEDLVYLVLNKPAGYVTSRRDSYGRKTVYDLLPADLRPKIWSVGRLDYETEGLLIFTNDGELTQALTHPSFEHEKEYGVEINSPLSEKDKQTLREGVEINGRLTAPAKVTNVKGKRVNIVIHEGRKRQVRRMFSELGYQVLKLTRVREGKLDLAKLNLPSGQARRMERRDII